MIDQPEKKIKRIRELKNLSQDYLAIQLGLTTRAYAKIESGETQLTLKRLKEISTILDVSPYDVLGFDEKQVFNSCKQEGNIGINHISIPEKLIEQMQKEIEHLKSEIVFLRAQFSKE